jgi:RimJ/RimL family protein N-acetyltransferase
MDSLTARDQDRGATPVRFPIYARLRDDTPAMIWPLLPTDGPGLARGYTELSSRSRELRFLTSRGELGPDMLRRLVDSVDQRAHVAFVLVALPPGEPDEVVGVGRLVQDDTDPTAADIAVTVRDDWQGRGVGALLAEALVAHRPPQVSRLETSVAVENDASLSMLRRLGPTTVVRSYPGVYDVHVQLPAIPHPRQADEGAADLAA